MKKPPQKKRVKSQKKRSKKRIMDSLPLIHLNAAGIDVGSEGAVRDKILHTKIQ